MKRIIIYLILLFVTTTVFAQDDNFEGRQEDPEMEALRKWIREKRMITVKEIGGDLSISGEVRVELQAFNEKRDGVRQRGEGSPTSRPDYALDVEFNLMLDYHTDRTWSVVKVEFDNDMGVIGGTTNHIALEKAYFGGRMVDGETFNFDGELGRRNLGNIFDSKIQYSTLFDGGLLKFNKSFESIGDFYTNLGVFLVNDYFYHFGEVIELGMLRIGNTGLFTKYSFINWKKKYSNRADNRRYNFANSQLILGYQGNISNFDKYYKVYLGGLMNHLAKGLDVTDYQKERYAWYVGFSIGRVIKAKDWALDVNFQYVMPQAVPEFDAAGIGRGNAQGVGFYTQNINGTGNLFTNKSQPVGSTNFKGFHFEFLYAISNNMTLLQNFEISDNQTKNIGPNLTYKKYEMEMIYAF